MVKWTFSRRLMVWAVVIIAVPTFLCAGWMGRLTQQALSENHARNVGMLGQTLCAALVARGDASLSEASGRLLDVLNADPRLAFVVVMDENHQLLHRRTADPDAWVEHRTWLENQVRSGQLDVNRPVYHGHLDELVVYKLPILNPPLYQDNPNTKATAPVNRTLEGYLVLAMRDHQMGQLLGGVRTTQLAGTGLVVFVAGLLSIWGVRRWTRPMRHLVMATERLGRGEPPLPVVVSQGDELGLLADSFNRMARRLITTKQRLMRSNDELMHANANLEEKVEQRTHELAQVVKQLRTVAATDPLTGLANRRAFDQSLNRRFANAQRKGENLACVMIDLDGFKQFNDSMGHPKGDELLVRCAKVLASACRAGDLAGRLGGDEFILLLPDASWETAAGVARRVQQAFAMQARQILPGIGSGPAPVTMSLGLACLTQSAAATPADLLSLADQALYRAKAQGKNRMVVYHRSLRQAA